MDERSIRVCRLTNWSEKWKLGLNIQKCKIVLFGRNVDNTYQYCIKNCDSQLIPLQRSTTVKDLGI